MSIKGRKPLPNAIKKITGVRKSRIKNEPKMPKLRDSDAPDYLDELGKEKWNQLYPILKRTGVLLATDADILAVCCDAYSTWRKANKELHLAVSLEIETPNGGRQQAPIVATERNARLTYMRALTELGLTPSSRARLNVASDETPELAELNAMIRQGQQDVTKGEPD